MGNIDLRGSSELFDLLVTNVNGLAIFTLDAEGRVASWNESLKNFWAITTKRFWVRGPMCFSLVKTARRRSPKRN